MNRIREILRTQYIGAIVIGYLAAVSLIGLVAAIISPLSFRLLNTNRQYRGVFNSEPQLFDWNALIVAIVKIALQLGIAYLLLRWLYLREDPIPNVSAEESGDDAIA